MVRHNRKELRRRSTMDMSHVEMCLKHTAFSCDAGAASGTTILDIGGYDSI